MCAYNQANPIMNQKRPSTIWINWSSLLGESQVILMMTSCFYHGWFSISITFGIYHALWIQTLSEKVRLTTLVIIPQTLPEKVLGSIGMGYIMGFSYARPSLRRLSHCSAPTRCGSLGWFLNLVAEAGNIYGNYMHNYAWNIAWHLVSGSWTCRTCR